ncbi:MAG: peptidoglycan-binding protein, partial [Parabacteroides sp.]|nr:peptidoglycan-binding protein [Parabacteroides sp.]
TANGLMVSCDTISKKQLQPGDFVFRVKKGVADHIGYVVDELYVIEAYGRDKGVIKRTLNAGGTSYWNAFGRPSKLIQVKKAQASKYTFTRILKKGCNGDDVKALQKLLNEKGFTCGSVDGDFGKNTKAAVKEFQKAKKLTKDGIAGKNTITALGGIWKG